ncbi:MULTISPECIES: hypothetical protein [unclassified Lysobacter]|uniref:hypothetical protein n=1 Tax=unclassified Lysobacter TaxID=2635362 RepID=UPI001C2334EE|nr:hypothetical protein [Lysobacter sp. MMG2]MBU8975695.1 hypothetical protein [Lysobacter sp. MMG2]
MRRQSGFAYLFLLFLLALMAVSALALASIQHIDRVRSNEAELLRIGDEFRRAIIRYRDAGMPRAYPRTLEELLLDRRMGRNQRHLRKIYADPLTGKAEWGLVLEQGAIVGVHSLSERVPLKVSGFDPDDADFENALRYADWVFRASPVPAEMRLPGRPPSSQRAAGG